MVASSFLHVNSTKTNDISKLNINFITLCNYFTVYIGFIVYDDGCHLKKFAINPVRSMLTDTFKKIKDMNIVIDRMHSKGHIDHLCPQHCNPHDFVELEGVQIWFQYYPYPNL